MTARILLFATVPWTSIARLAGAFAQSGAEVSALSPPAAPVLVSRYTMHAFPFRHLGPLQSLRDAIAFAKYDVIVPCDDRAVDFLLRLYKEASRAEPTAASLIRRSLGNAENYSRLMSRADFIHCAQKLGISAPETVSICKERDLARHLARFTYPLVLKADCRWGGEGVVVANCREEAFAGYKKLSALSSRLQNISNAATRGDLASLYSAVHHEARGISLQAFVAGSQATTAFAAWQGSVIASLHFDVVVAQNSTGPACVLRHIDCAEMETAARRVAQRFGLTGLHGLDFIRNNAGKTHLIEMNPRAVQASYLPFGPIHDLAAAMVASMAKTELHARPGIEEEAVAFFPSEWRRDPTSRHLISAFHDVPWDDPEVLRLCLGFPVWKGRKTTGEPDTESPDSFIPHTFERVRHIS